jgi:hypothetical protein
MFVHSSTLQVGWRRLLGSSANSELESNFGRILNTMSEFAWTDCKKLRRTSRQLVPTEMRLSAEHKSVPLLFLQIFWVR